MSNILNLIIIIKFNTMIDYNSNLVNSNKALICNL